MDKQTICFVAGKSGGHIIPCLRIAQKYRAEKKTDVLFFSTTSPLDASILSKNTLILKHVPLPLISIACKKWRDYIKIFWHLIASFISSIIVLHKHKPTEIITTGGVVAIPVCLAGLFLRIPITLYCLDVVPGKALQFLMRYATNRYACFKQTVATIPQTEYVQYPITYKPQDCIATNKAREQLHINQDAYTIFVLGGSQGSVFLNTCIKHYIMSSYRNTTPPLHIIHQTGTQDSFDWQAFYAQHDIQAHVFTYQDNLAPFYASADLIICRAGAGTLFEVNFFKKPSIIVPLITATTDHQVANAIAFTQENPSLYTWISEQSIHDNPQFLFSLIQQYISQKDL